MKFIVTSCAETVLPSQIVYDGQDIEAMLPGIEVRLADDDGGCVQMLRYVVKDIAAELAKFEVGATINVTYERAA